MSDESDDFRIRAILTHQLSAFKGFTSPFTAMQERKQMLTEVARLSKKKWDPRELWNLYRDTVPETTACALALLSLTASEAAVERTFSKQSLVHSKLRTPCLPNPSRRRCSSHSTTALCRGREWSPMATLS